MSLRRLAYVLSKSMVAYFGQSGNFDPNRLKHIWVSGCQNTITVIYITCPLGHSAPFLSLHKSRRLLRPNAAPGTSAASVKLKRHSCTLQVPNGLDAEPATVRAYSGHRSTSAVYVRCGQTSRGRMRVYVAVRLLALGLC